MSDLTPSDAREYERNRGTWQDDFAEGVADAARAADRRGRPGCESCSWADGGCSLCNPRSAIDRIKADEDAETEIEAQAAAAMSALDSVLALPPTGLADVALAVDLDSATIQLRTVLPPRLWDWAKTEIVRRCQAFMAAGVEANQAALAGIRSLTRDAIDGEV